MRIGVMLRTLDRFGGTGIYARNIIKHLIQIDQKNEYILIFNDEKECGVYQHFENVEEIVVPRAHPIFWDQVQIPKIIRKHEIDLIFNTKFSVPIFTKAKKVMVLHGASWFTHPELYGKFDIFYVKSTMPFYCKSADFLVSNSDLTTNDFKNLFNIPDKKIETVLLAAGEEFQLIDDDQLLEGVKRKYQLPDRFILTVTGYDPRKNFVTLLKAFEQCHKKRNISLVVVGKDCGKYAKDFNLEARGLDKVVHFPGWIDQKDLPAIYNLADAFVFPSVYEEFGIPVVEAMSCGCPVVSSNTGAIPSLTNGAALLCNPFDYQMLAKHILQILFSKEISSKCQREGLERAKKFSWSQTAKQTLEILNQF